MLSIQDVELQGKKVLLRVDFNVPLKEGQVVDDSRIRAALPTLQHILEQGGLPVICSHLGKPKGKFVQELSLQPVAERLSRLLQQEVVLAPDCIGPEVKSRLQELKSGQVLLLENLRFHPGETSNDQEFSKELASLTEGYVNDAFGVVHRAHASVHGVPQQFSQACAGLLLHKEVEYLTQALLKPEHPFVLISGGSKVADKLGILQNLMPKVDRIIVGGAMSNTFRKAQGYPVGNSKTEDDLLASARQLMDQAKAKGVSFYLPVDYVLAQGPKSQSPSGVFPFQDLPEQDMILDTGPATHALFSEVLKDARTVVWNGPMGVFENPAFSQGSVGLAQSVASLENALTIVGGGDTDALIHDCQLQDRISFISTGGGSFLEFMEGKDLPGLQVLGFQAQKR
ncbi:MAG: phosphoglycerate kinase [Desulfohalobiaceae bacterium]